MNAQEKQEPFCKLRAESIINQKMTIIDYFVIGNIEIPEIYLNEKETIDVHKLYNKDLSICLNININNKNQNICIEFTDELCEYFVDEHNIYSIDDLLNINIDFSVKSNTEIYINDIVVPILSKHKTNTSVNIKQYDGEHIDIFEKAKKEYIDKKNKEIKQLWLKNKFIGEGKIIDYKQKEDENCTYTTLLIRNNNDDVIEFDLEHPLFYDDNNSVINFINKVGGGSLKGLKGETVLIESIKNVDNPPAVNDCLCITSKTNNEKIPHDELEPKITSYILFSFILISSYVCIFGIRMLDIHLTIVSFIVLVINYKLWSTFRKEYLN